MFNLRHSSDGATARLTKTLKAAPEVRYFYLCFVTRMLRSFCAVYDAQSYKQSLNVRLWNAVNIEMLTSFLWDIRLRCVKNRPAGFVPGGEGEVVVPGQGIWSSVLRGLLLSSLTSSFTSAESTWLRSARSTAAPGSEPSAAVCVCFLRDFIVVKIAFHYNATKPCGVHSPGQSGSLFISSI